ncbi:MAG: hypothetical protein KF859_10435 [Phycisphaeraceae bacterium]|nr:hypothetical protein [Phycisphaeraceae bacterium]
MQPSPAHSPAVLRCSALLALTLAAGGAWAQDSVSRNANGGNGLPGDALSPWSGTLQRSNFVVDLAPFTTSWGTPFGLGPVAKSGRTNNNTRFTAFNGASSISQTTRTGVTPPSASYLFWNQPTGGIHPTDNVPALNQSLSPSGDVSLLGVGFMDYDEIIVSNASVLVNQIVGALIAFEPANPARLYVTRVVAAHNNGLSQTDRSQFGYGGVDAHGNVSFRADSFGSAGTASSLLQGDNIFRVRLADRTSTINLIDNTGASQAASTDWLVQRSTLTHNTPAALPADIAGRPFTVGADFLGNFLTEASPGALTPTVTHRPGTLDHRGGPTLTGLAIFPGSSATGAMLTRATGSPTKTNALSLFGLNAAGSVTTARTLPLPPTLTDACDAFAWPLGGGDFRHYDSQVTFRGGSGQAATTLDRDGRAIAAAVLYNGTIPGTDNPYNAIAAVRFNPAVVGSPPQWTIVAWVNPVAMTGKDILGDFGADGVPNTGDAGEGDGVVDATDAPIGRLASLTEGPTGFVGPSISAPTFDSAGNIYFISAVSLRKQVGPVIEDKHTIALVRGVYNPQTFCYSLDLVAEVGQQFAGLNSARNYRISALNLADSDSISTASLWASSASQNPWNNTDTSGLDQTDPRHLGGLVLSARIVYDVNQDGLFEDPTALAGNADSEDEAYNVILYIGNITPADGGEPCYADYNQDGGVDGQDVEAFFLDWEAGDSAADVNQDGGVDGQDVEFFFLQWEAGGC